MRALIGAALSCTFVGRVLVGCSSFGTSAEPPAVTPAAPACDPTKPFNAPQPMPELDTDDPSSLEGVQRLTPDELTVFFASTRLRKDGAVLDSDLFMATRKERTAKFEQLTRVESVNNLDSETAPWISPDGLTLFFASNRGGASSLDFDIFRTARKTTSDGFGAPDRLPISATGPIDTSPFLDPAQSEGFFASSRGLDGGVGSLDSHLWTFKVGESVARPLPSTGSDKEDYPVLSADGLRLFFALQRGPSKRKQIAYADRPERASAFGSPAIVPGLATEADPDDAPGWVSVDGCRLYFLRGPRHFVAERGL